MSLLAEETIAWPWRSPCSSPRPPRRARWRSLGTRVRGAALARSRLPLARATSASLKSLQRKDRQVLSVYPKPALTGPLGLAAASVGKVQLVVFGSVGSGAGGNK